MAEQSRKMSLLTLLQLLLKKTDEDHLLNASQIGELLEQEGISVDRRTIYKAIDSLTEFGIDIIQKKGSNSGYYVGSREFELPELKLLVDAVQASKFMTAKKSEELIKKLENQTSEYKARELNREVFIRNRMKTENEKIFYNVDDIHEAMNRDRQITFRYGEWTVEKRLVPRKNGALYRVSPWALSWDDENYYLIAYDREAGKIKHYRVDKMTEIKVLDQSRFGKEEFANFDLASYTKKTFGMFGGEEAKVTLLCHNRLVGVMIDRFGTDMTLFRADEGHFRIIVPVQVSPQFYGWVLALGRDVVIEGPVHVRTAYRRYLQDALENYEVRD
jgi:predicted DNA-binding transcriptional regulator YafY